MAGRIPIAVAHLDESCLGNGREGENPGGAGGLVEIRHRQAIERREFFIHAPSTTNNRMALSGAIALLQLLAGKGKRLQVLLISDSEYLVRGVREWLPAWVSRGWTRKAGPIENLELWKALYASLSNHDVTLCWVRGHAGHAKNEFANDLAVKAAKEQVTSAGLVEATFPDWLEGQRKKRRYAGYDADQTFATLEARIAAGERLPLALEEVSSAAQAGS